MQKMAELPFKVIQNKRQIEITYIKFSKKNYLIKNTIIN